jgi:hypothetical protein
VNTTTSNRLATASMNSARCGRRLTWIVWSWLLKRTWGEEERGVRVDEDKKSDRFCLSGDKKGVPSRDPSAPGAKHVQ